MDTPTTPRPDSDSSAQQPSDMDMTPPPSRDDDGAGGADIGTGAGRPTAVFSQHNPTSSPVRFATTTNAFGLTASPASSSSSGPSAATATSGPPTTLGAFGSLGPRESQSQHQGFLGVNLSSGFGGIETATLPPTIGVGTSKRVRRPSMLSMQQTASFGSESSRDGLDTARPLLSPIPHDPGPSSGKRPLTPIAPAPSPNPFSSTQTTPPPPASVQVQVQPIPRFGAAAFLSQASLRRTSSAPLLPFDGLTTTTPPVPFRELDGDGNGDGHSGNQSPMEMEMDADSGADPDMGMEMGDHSRSPLRWVPHHLQPSSTPASRRKGKARLEDSEYLPTSPRARTRDSETGMHRPPFTGKPLPAPLLATLISEATPLEHEMRSEARLQRLLTSHPHALPFTPRAPRSSRGRFPETADEDDDDDGFFGRRPSWARRSWIGRAGDSDSESDDMPMDDSASAPEPVNAAFAAGMDMDRPASSSSSSWPNDGSGKSTPGAGQIGSGSANGGVVPAPDQGQNQNQTQNQNQNQNQNQGQPTPPSNNAPWPDRMKAGRGSLSTGMGLVPSPGTGFGLPSAFGGLGMGTGTPLTSPIAEKLEASAQTEDRFDPYKRPRGSSPSFSGSPSFPMSPSRSTQSAIPIPNPQSPGHIPIYPSALSASGSTPTASGRPRPTHPYNRPLASRSRAASPALSIGSASGVLSSSLGNNGREGRGSFTLPGTLAGAFVPTGVTLQNGGAQPLGGLGLLSLAGRDERDRDEAVEMIREDSRESEQDGGSMSASASASGSAMEQD